MNLRKSNRAQAKIRCALQGPSGSGKTYSSLILAHGLCKDWKKIAVIDTENHSADLYSHLGEYNVLTLSAPFTPERYMEAIEVCEKADMEVIIIDSISHEWEGDGGILDIHSGMVGNSFTNWAKLTPRHNALVQKILTSQKHIIATVRSKQEYVLSEKNGKSVPEKVGMKMIQRDGLEYDFTLVFEIDINHNATCTKDRTQLFNNKISFKIDESTGEKIMNWCVDTNHQIEDGNPVDLINACNNLDELTQLYKTNPLVRTKEKELNSKANLLRREAIQHLPKHNLNGNYHE